jgi:hypothetical protein
MSCTELRFKTATLRVWINGIERNEARGGATPLDRLQRTGVPAGYP